MKMLDFALSYASDGMAVLPLHKPHGGGCSCGKTSCKSVGKHPLAAAVPHGKDDASAELGEVRRWWTTWPTANIGIRPAEGMVVIDVDPRHNGHATLSALVFAHSPLPETLTAHTGSGGLHYWFTAPSVRVGTLGDGLDVKTAGGYLVAPPSLHESGERYRWLTPVDVAPAPTWLCRLLCPTRPRAPRTVGPRRDGGTGLVRTVAEAPEGRRNTLLWWAAKKAHVHGDRGLVDQIRQAAIDNGLDPHAVDGTIRSAERWAAGGGSR